MRRPPGRAGRPGAENEAGRRRRAGLILRRLRREFPGAATALRHGNPFQLLVATILSAQCTDQRVNMVTPALFERYEGPADFARAALPELERLIHSTGFFRMKARNIARASRALVKRHGGRVPRTMEELTALPGVGRKTANVVLGQAWGIVSGIVVDTHVQRTARRLGLTDATAPEKAEQDLMAAFPPAAWIEIASVLILHGRKTCGARRPACDRCSLADVCPSASLAGEGASRGFRLTGA
ncbi:MAG: endonuclease III [Bacteroidota bacterium]